MNDSTKTESPFSREVVLQRPFDGQIQHNSYDSSHGFDLYHGAGAGPRPCVVLVCGFPDTGFRQIFGSSWKDTSPVTSWARLLAASGLSAVTLQADDPVADTCVLLDYLKSNADSLGLDSSRIGLWSCSGNVPTALAVLEQSPDLVAAALLYGFMMEPEDDKFVSRAAGQFRFANPELGDRLLASEARLLVVQAGKDEFPGVNASIDYFMQRSSEQGNGAELLGYDNGVHAFDVMDDSAQARAVIEQVLDFLLQALTPVRR